MPDWPAFALLLLAVIVTFGAVIPWLYAKVSDPPPGEYGFPFDDALVTFGSWAVGLAVLTGLIVWRVT